MKKLVILFLVGFTIALFQAKGQSWTADNGNGTYTNPLFFDEFSDPDIIRVGEDLYLAGTTKHAMPGLVVLHSKDLANWKFVSYAFDSLTLGKEFYLKDGKAACFNGRICCIANVCFYLLKPTGM